MLGEIANALNIEIGDLIISKKNSSQIQEVK